PGRKDIKRCSTEKVRKTLSKPESKLWLIQAWYELLTIETQHGERFSWSRTGLRIATCTRFDKRGHCLRTHSWVRRETGYARHFLHHHLRSRFALEGGPARQHPPAKQSTSVQTAGLRQQLTSQLFRGHI